MIKSSNIVSASLLAVTLCISTTGVAEESATGTPSMQPGSIPMTGESSDVVPMDQSSAGDASMAQGGPMPMGPGCRWGKHTMGPQGGMPMGQGQQGQMPMMMGNRGGMMNPKMMQHHRMRPQQGMPMGQGQQGQMPMMMGNRGGMMNPQMMGQRQQMMQQHMQTMQQHMSNIEALLKELVDLQKAK